MLVLLLRCYDVCSSYLNCFVWFVGVIDLLVYGLLFGFVRVVCFGLRGCLCLRCGFDWVWLGTMVYFGGLGFFGVWDFGVFRVFAAVL